MTTQHAPRPAPRTYTRRNLESLVRRFRLDPALAHEAQVVSHVLPFRVSAYVVEELIDWDDPAHDPIFRLTFPRRGMLEPEAFDRIEDAIERGAAPAEIAAIAARIQESLNPHPAGQLELNVPTHEGRPLDGVQHKYPDTLLYFPAEGQTCHAYCTYCFRWPQFVPGQPRFATRAPEDVADYLRAHPEVTDVLITGGDPLVMRTAVLAKHLDPFMAPDLAHLRIRIGSKALSYHPDRFLGDRDADDLLRLFERITGQGHHLSLMAHFSHPRELIPAKTVVAIGRILATGAAIRCQAPLIRGVNDSAEVWARMWQRQANLGAIPYYMFVERDTGARRYFEVPLARALTIYDEASSGLSGLARTARGPVMSAMPGKVLVDGRVETTAGEAFVLKLIRARESRASNRVELARMDPSAAWLDDLESMDRPGAVPFLTGQAVSARR